MKRNVQSHPIPNSYSGNHYVLLAFVANIGDTIAYLERDPHIMFCGSLRRKLTHEYL